MRHDCIFSRLRSAPPAHRLGKTSRNVEGRQQIIQGRTAPEEICHVAYLPPRYPPVVLNVDLNRPTRPPDRPPASSEIPPRATSAEKLHPGKPRYKLILRNRSPPPHNPNKRQNRTVASQNLRAKDRNIPDNLDDRAQHHHSPHNKQARRRNDRQNQHANRIRRARTAALGRQHHIIQQQDLIPQPARRRLKAQADQRLRLLRCIEGVEARARRPDLDIGGVAPAHLQRDLGGVAVDPPEEERAVRPREPGRVDAVVVAGAGDRVFLLAHEGVRGDVLGAQVDGQPVREGEEGGVPLLFELVGEREGVPRLSAGEVDGVAVAVVGVRVVDSDERELGPEGVARVPAGLGGVLA